MTDDIFDFATMPEKKKTGFTHDSVNNKTVDWYTPKWIFDELELEFDLDPCAPAFGVFKNEVLRNYGISPSEYNGGVPWIPAKHYYDIYSDGLASDWFGRVWLNPPYGKAQNMEAWLQKMHHHRNGIGLFFARTDTKWFHDFCAKADAILFIQKRVKFIDGLGVTGESGAGAGSILVAWGDECVEALERMSHRGLFVKTGVILFA